MGQDIPKQFINVYDKPVIVYTFESFRQYPMVRYVYCHQQKGDL